MTLSVKQVDALLPQTQCRACGYAGCLPYAEAMVQGKAGINHCPPGGVETLEALATLFKIDPTPYIQDIVDKHRPPAVALIDEKTCIGCTKCIQACPVDAIIGSAKHMHQIITDECTGCELCVEPCPVNCIEIKPVSAHQYNPDQARRRYYAKQSRSLRAAQEKEALYQQKRKLAKNSDQQEMNAKRDYIQAAMARVAEKKKG